MSFFALFLFVLQTPSVSAAARTWDGGGSDGTCGGAAGDGNKWSCAANWSSDLVPGAADTATFNGTSTKAATIDAAYGGSIAGISVTSAYTGTITQARSLTVGGSNFVMSGGTFVGGPAIGDTLDMNGNLTLNSGSTFTMPRGGVTMAGNLTSKGTFTGTNGGNNTTITFDGGVVGSSITLNDGATFNASDNTAPTVVFARTSGAGIITVESGGTIYATATANSGDIVVTGTLNLIGSTVHTAANVTVSGVLNLTAAGMNIVGNLTVNSGGAVTLGSTNGLNIDTNISVASGASFSATNNDTALLVERLFTVDSSIDLSKFDVTLDGTASTDDTTWEYPGTVDSLTINKTNSGSITTISSGLTILDNFIWTDGPVAGDGTTATWSVGTSGAGNMSFAASGDTFSVSTITFEMKGTGSITDSNTAITETYNFEVDASGNTVSLGANLTLTGTCIANAGTLSLAGFNLSCTSVTLNGSSTLQAKGSETLTTPTVGSSTITYSFVGDGDTAVDTFTPAWLTGTIGNLVVNTTDTGDIIKLAGNTTAGGSVTITQGSLDLDVTNNRSLAVAGDFTRGNSDIATFLGRNGAVTFNGTNQLITVGTGSISFYSFTKVVASAATLTFANTGTIDVTNAIDLRGVSGNLLSLRSSSGGVARPINVSGTRTLQYLDVQDSNNENATAMTCGVGCVNSANNTNWAFPGVTISAVSGNTTEAGGTATFTAVLITAPTADVTFTLTSTDTTEGTVSPSSLTFTTGNWDTPQTVTVTGVNDSLDDGDIVYSITTGATSSVDSGYNGLTVADVSVTNTDNDTSGFTVSAISGNTTEAGGTATFTVVLTAQPTADVTVGLTSDDTTEGTISPSSFTFTSGNWDTPQTGTVTGVNDSIDDGDVAYSIVTAAATSGDSNYNGLNPANVSVSNTDNDTAGVTVSVISGNTTEAGGTATFTVVLNTQPTGNVVITSTSADGTEGAVTSGGTLTFTTGNWDTPQTITVTGQNDSLDDGDVGYTITVAMDTDATADAVYDVINPSDVSVTNTDNDISGFTVSTISGNTTEAGGTATFTVVLTAQPTADVTVGLTSDDTTEGTISPSSFTFTSGNWDTPQTGTVTGVNDSLDDGDVSYSIVTGAATSADSNYNGLNPANISATNTDNDISGFTVSTISGNTTEAGGTATFTVVLTAQPTADVVVGLTSDDTTEGTISPSSFTFTSGNWDTPQTGTVTGVDDGAVDGDITYSIVTAAATSGDSNYNGLNPANISVINTDNDTVGVTVSAISGNTTEAGGTATFTVVLDTQPTGDVVITSTSTDSTEGVVTSGGTLTFTTGNWDTPQTVTVTGQNDALDDGDVGYTITILVDADATADAAYDAINPADVSATNTDNDTSGFTVSTISGNTTEAGGTATFTVVLNAQPTEDVTVSLTSDDTTEGTISPSSFTFTSGNWSTPQTGTVTGVNDSLDDGDVSYSIVTGAATSGDSNYNGLNPADVSVTNTDNDTSGFTVSTISGNTTEAGGTATFTVVLNAQPTEDVTVSLTSDDTTEGTISPSSFTFTSGNWSTPQTGTVTGVNDSLDDGDVSYSIVTGAATSADSNYNGLNPSNISVTNTDNDTAGVTVSAISGNTTEAGGTATFTIVLNTQPTGNVVITSVSADSTEGVVTSGGTLTFTTGNWDTPQTVTVTGQNDALDDGNIGYTITVSTDTDATADTTYDAINPADVSATNTDNDTSGFTVSTISGNTTEAGGTATFTVVLTAQPTADVTVGLTSNDTTEGTISPSSFTFTSGNWDTPQTGTVTGVNDSLDDGDIAYSIVTGAATSADSNYNGLNPANVSVTNTDNDTSGFTVSAISGNTTEAGGTATFTVVLNAQPTADVTVSLTSDDTTEGTISPSSFTFTSGNWDTPQTGTVTGVDDGAGDGDIAYSIVTGAATSGDSNYNGLNPANVSVTNTDNDVAGVTVSVISGNTTEAGGTATFTIVLNTQPTGDVVITSTSTDGTEGAVTSGGTLTFTTGNWDTPQTVTVTGQNDALDDGNIGYTITVSTDTDATADTTYDAINPADVSATNTDNDTSGFTVSTISGNTTEAGGTATFTVVLTAQPTADVVVGLTSDDTSEGTVSPASLTFTSGNWDTPQMVTVIGVDDGAGDGDIAYSIVTGAATSGDSNYNGLNPSNVSVTNTDDEAVGVTVSAISGNTTEAGGTATFTVVLNTQPTGDVVITSTSADSTEGSVTSGGTLTFTTGNWDTPQTVTVTGQNDSLDDGNVGYTITILVDADATADAAYDAINPADVSATNTDNDTSGFTVSTISGNTTEAGGTATFTVVLTAQPTADVVVGLTSDDTTEGTISPSSFTFTSGNWDTPQTGTVTGVNDSLDDGDIAYSIVTGAATSGDSNYNGLNPANISVTNTDNDTVGVTVSAISGNTTESGGTATFTVVLNTQPSGNVVITSVSTDATEGVVTSGGTLTFTTGNWDAPQTVTVTGQNDALSDGDIDYTITVSMDTDATVDTAYDAINPGDVSATNTDNDTVGFTISAISGNTTEAGGTATFTVVLNTQPTGDVTLGLSSNDLTEGTVSPSTLTFTSGNWDTPQTVTVTGVNDSVDDGNIGYSITTGAASSADGNYNNVNPSDVSVTNTDNDTAGFLLTSAEDPLSIAEEGETSDTYTLVLLSEPTADVVVTFIADGEISVDVSPRTFTSLNWNAPQTITVTAVDDDEDESDPHTTIVSHTVASVDPLYDNTSIDDVSVSIEDNDQTSSGGGGRSVTLISGGSFEVSWLGSVCTDRRSVQLSLRASGASEMRISNDAGFEGAVWEEFRSEVFWTLAGDEGAQTVYAQFRASSGNISGVFFDSVELGEQSSSCEEEALPEEELPTVPGDESAQEPLPSFGISPFNGSTEKVALVPDGVFIRGVHYPTVYFMENGFRRPLLDEQTFFTWKTSFDDVWVVTDATLPFYPLGTPLLPKPGKVLVKIQSDSNVYATESGASNVLRRIQSEEDAYLFFGPAWNAFIIDLPPTVFVRYSMGETLLGTTYKGLLYTRIGLQPNDPDRDGLTDIEEGIWGTDRLTEDTDGDRYPDGIEVKAGRDPKN